MNFEPQTYEELIRMKRCVELTKYYELTEGDWRRSTVSWNKIQRLPLRAAGRISLSSGDRIPKMPR